MGYFDETVFDEYFDNGVAPPVNDEADAWLVLARRNGKR